MTNTKLHEYGSLQNIKVNEAFSKLDLSLSKWLNELYGTLGVVEPGLWAESLPTSTRIAQLPFWAAAYEWEVAARFLCVDKKSGHGLLRARFDGACRAILKRHSICKILGGFLKGEAPVIDSLLPIWLVSGTGGYLEHARRVLDKGECEYVDRPRAPVKDVGPSRIQLWLHVELVRDGEAEEQLFPFAEFLFQTDTQGTPNPQQRAKVKRDLRKISQAQTPLVLRAADQTWRPRLRKRKRFKVTLTCLSHQKDRCTR